MTGEKAPLIVFAYKRQDKLERLLGLIEGLDGIENTDVYFYCDGPKSAADNEQVLAVRNVVSRWCVVNKSINTFINASEKNKGLAKSVIEGVTEVINKYGKAIVLEDDLIISKDFLKYMNALLDYYKDNKKVWSISAYSPIAEFPGQELLKKVYDSSVYTSERAYCWGWATWKNRWDLVDWDVKSYGRFKYNFFKRKGFAKWGKDLPSMLDSQMYGLIDSWYIRWTYEAYLKRKVSIYPIETRVINDGFDGSGTHCTADRGLQRDAESAMAARTVNHEIVPLKDVTPNETIRQEFIKGTGSFILREIKWLMIKWGWIPKEIGTKDVTGKLLRRSKK